MANELTAVEKAKRAINDAEVELQELNESGNLEQRLAAALRLAQAETLLLDALTADVEHEVCDIVGVSRIEEIQIENDSAWEEI